MKYSLQKGEKNGMRFLKIESGELIYASGWGNSESALA
jgi:hypothetical protein